MRRRAVGVVAALYRYPVKSMRGEAVATADLYWHGFEGDRRYAFVRSGNLSSFPWLTAREAPALLRYAPYFVDPERPRESPVRVRTPAGGDLPVESEALLMELTREYGGPVHLMQLNRGAPDSAHLSVVGLPSVRAVGERLGLHLDPRRFRQNVYLEPLGGEPFAEESWLGGLLAFGADEGARVRLIRRDPRCMMVNLDPDHAAQNPAVLREIARARDNCLGLYATVDRLGPVRLGDTVYLEMP